MNLVEVENRLIWLASEFRKNGHKPVCYIAGPMTGLPHFNEAAFNNAAKMLREAGWEVFNPVENDAEAGIILEGQTGHEDFDYKRAMKRDLAQVCTSDAVIVLPGWEESKGASLETHVAHEVGVPVYTFLSQRRVEKKPTWDEAIVAVQQAWALAEAKEQNSVLSAQAMRTFDSGATRNRDDDAYDYEGFLCPLVIQRYGEYMHSHRRQADGTIRASDNWQRGIPVEQYMKSLLRHVHDVWMEVRGYESREGIEKGLCGVLFNGMGMLHEVLKGEQT